MWTSRALSRRAGVAPCVPSELLVLKQAGRALERYSPRQIPDSFTVQVNLTLIYFLCKSEYSNSHDRRAGRARWPLLQKPWFRERALHVCCTAAQQHRHPQSKGTAAPKPYVTHSAERNGQGIGDKKWGPGEGENQQQIG
jgi:hypothetical protein